MRQSQDVLEGRWAVLDLGIVTWRSVTSPAGWEMLTCNKNLKTQTVLGGAYSFYSQAPLISMFAWLREL